MGPIEPVGPIGPIEPVGPVLPKPPILERTGPVKSFRYKLPPEALLK